MWVFTTNLIRELMACRSEAATAVLLCRQLVVYKYDAAPLGSCSRPQRLCVEEWLFCCWWHGAVVSFAVLYSYVNLSAMQ